MKIVPAIVGRVLAAHRNPVVRPIMVRLLPLENARHVAHRALRAIVVLAGARCPRTRVPDMYLAGGMVEAEEAAGQDGDEVLLIVDVRDAEPERVDVVREVLVPDAREAVPDEAHGGGGDLQVEVYGVEEGDGSALGRIY